MSDQQQETDKDAHRPNEDPRKTRKSDQLPEEQPEEVIPEGEQEPEKD